MYVSRCMCLSLSWCRRDENSKTHKQWFPLILAKSARRRRKFFFLSIPLILHPKSPSLLLVHPPHPPARTTAILCPITNSFSSFIKTSSEEVMAQGGKHSSSIGFYSLFFGSEWMSELEMVWDYLSIIVCEDFCNIEKAFSVFHVQGQLSYELSSACHE